jgi:hypothetical protein
MDFRAAIRFPFRGAHKWANLGLVFVCMLIPFIGGVVVSGYQVLMEKRLIADINAEAPRFDFGQFVRYLQIGLWPFLVTLIILLPMLFLFYVPLIVGIVLLVVGVEKHPVPAILGFAILLIVDMLLLVMAMAIVRPLALKAGLEQAFDKAFSWTFFKAWWQRVGWLSVGVTLAFMGMALGFYIVVACTFIGVYALVPLAIFVQAHLQAQLYRLYLDRGGVPLQFEQEPLIGTFPVVPVAVPPPQAPPVQ